MERGPPHSAGAAGRRPTPCVPLLSPDGGDSGGLLSRFFLTVVAPARRDDALERIEGEYLKRLSRHTDASVVRVRPGGGSAAEAERIRGRTPANARCVALDVRGDALGSEALAERLRRARDGAVPGFAFWIGGADGLDASLLDEAHFRLSLGPMVMAHRIARLVLVEQLYRAMSILRGEPYHRA